MAVHRGNIMKGLRTTATLVDHCGGSSAPSGEVHHTPKRHNSIHVPYHLAKRRHYSKEVQTTASGQPPPASYAYGLHYWYLILFLFLRLSICYRSCIFHFCIFSAPG